MHPDPQTDCPRHETRFLKTTDQRIRSHGYGDSSVSRFVGLADDGAARRDGEVGGPVARVVGSGGVGGGKGLAERSGWGVCC